MRIFGFDIKKAVSSVGGGWHSVIREPFTGAWQRNMEEKCDTLISYPTLYACVSRIAQDVGKLPFTAKKYNRSISIWQDSSLPDALLKPNKYQTPQQFRESWLLSKLIQGNTYVLVDRYAGRISSLHILDPFKVMPLVDDVTGDVYYQINGQCLAGVTGNQITVPAYDIIHDRCITPFHPLIGLPPIAAANLATAKNMRILKSSAEFFGNNAQPSGILSAPGAISNETAQRLKDYWENGFRGANAGKIAVVGDGLSFQGLASKSVDAQMVEQLRYSDEQICQPFGIPPFKVGIGSVPAGMKVDDINQLYYSDALQTHIEAMEALLDQGLGIKSPEGIELDLEPLLRMDPMKKAEYEVKLVAGTVKSPNEARSEFDLKPMAGGDAIYMQQQNYSLEALNRRDQQVDPFSANSAVETVEPQDDEEFTEEKAQLLAALVLKELKIAN